MLQKLIDSLPLDGSALVAECGEHVFIKLYEALVAMKEYQEERDRDNGVESDCTRHCQAWLKKNIDVYFECNEVMDSEYRVSLAGSLE